MTLTAVRRSAIGIFFLALAVYMVTYVGAFKTNDERAMFSSTDSFIKRGEFTSNQIYWDYTNVGMLTSQGEMVPNYEPAQSVLSIPLYLWGRALNAPVQGVMFFGALVTAASVALLYLCLIELGYERRVSLFAALVYAFGTSAWAYSKTFFRDPLAVFAYLLAIYALLRYRPPATQGWLWPAVAGLALGIALTTKQVSVALIPALLVLVVAYERGRPSTIGERVRAAAAALLPLAGVLVLGQLYYAMTLSGVELFSRNVVDFTTNPQLSSSEPLRMVRAFLGLTISPFRGIFWYSPVLLLALPGAVLFLRRHRWEGIAFGLLIGAHLLGYSRSLYWSGGVGGAAWGARYMLSLLPFLVMLSAPVFEWALNGAKERGGAVRVATRAAVTLLVAVSVLVQVLGVSINPTTFELRHFLEQAEIWGGIGEAVDATYLNPAFSPVLGNLRLLLSGQEPLDVAWVQLRPEGGSALLPAALLLSLLNVALALGGLFLIWRRPRLAAPVGVGLAASTVLIASLLLLQYREGDSRFDPYNVDSFLQPLMASLETVPCHPAAPGEPRLCEGVLVVPDPLLTDYFLTKLRAPLPWYAIDAAPASEDRQLLDQLVERYPTIWLIRDRNAQADDTQGRRAVERHLAERAYKVEEQTAEGWGRLIRFSGAGTIAERMDGGAELGELSLEQAELSIQSDHSLPARAARAAPAPVEPLDDGLVRASVGDVLQVGLQWRARQAPEGNYTAFFQLLDSGGQVVIQRDRWPGDGLFPTMGLEPGGLLVDNVAIPLAPEAVAPGRYRLISGFYQGDIEGLPRLTGPGGDFMMLAEVEIR